MKNILFKIFYFCIIVYASQPAAQEISLFSDPSEEEIKEEEDAFDIRSAWQDSSYVRHRFANINSNLIQSLSHTRNDESSEIFSAQRESMTLDIELFPNISFQAQVESSRSTQFGGSFIQAKIVGGSTGFMTFMLGEDGAIRGEVHSSEGVFTISNGGSSSNRVLIKEVSIPQYPLGDDTIKIEISPEMIQPIPTRAQESYQDDSRYEPAEENQEASENSSQIDVLVLYTPNAKNTRTGDDPDAKAAAIERDIQQEVEKTNQALENSGAEVRIRLVGIEEISYTEVSGCVDVGSGNSQPSCIDVDLKNLRYKRGSMDADGKLDEVHKLRKQYSADFVHLVVDITSGGDGSPTNACGIAYTWNLKSISGSTTVYNTLKSVQHDWSQVNVSDNGQTITLSEFWKNSSSFSVSGIRDACRAIYTFAHELGHNISLFHDRDNIYLDDEGNPRSANRIAFPLYPYGYGYVDQRRTSTLCERTIMSYDNQCERESGTPQLRYIFSNPNKSFQTSRNPAGKAGEGFSTDVDGPADAVQAIQNADSNIAQLNLSSTSCTNALRVENKALPYTSEVNSEEHTLSVSLIPEYCDENLTLTSSQSKGITPSATSTTVLFDVPTSAGQSTATTTPMIFNDDDRKPKIVSVENPDEEDSISIQVSENLTPCPRTGVIDLQGLGFEENNEDILIHQESGHPLRYLIYQLNQGSADCETRITTAQIQTIKTVQLQNKDISALQQYDFSGLINVTDLDLSYNNIESLTDRVFAGHSSWSGDQEGLINVERINLSHNAIDSIDENAFEGLSAAAYLDLSSNSITDIPEAAFALLNSLTHLDLSFNSISSLPDFPSSLVKLNLVHNAITSLGSKLNRLTRLKYLWLNHNQLDALPTRLLNSSSNTLRTLALDHNNISSFPNNFFLHLKKLRYLWINNNSSSLHTLPPESFKLTHLPKLRYLNLSGNNFQTALNNDAVCEVIQNVRYVILDAGVTKNTLCPPGSSSSSQDYDLLSGMKSLLSAFFQPNSETEEFYDTLTYKEQYGAEQKEAVIKMFEQDNLDPDFISEITGVHLSTVHQMVHSH